MLRVIELTKGENERNGLFIIVIDVSMEAKARLTGPED